MQSPAKRNSERGLLLVEAVLSTVVIAVGLVFITRGLSSQLRALRSVETYGVLMSLAQGKLLELEAKGLAKREFSSEDREGVFQRPHEQYGWEITVSEDLVDATGEPIGRPITLTVQPREIQGEQVQFSAVWPVEWVPETWR